MKLTVLTVTALVATSITVAAQPTRRTAHQSSAYEAGVRAEPVPAPAAAIDNTRPAFAAHISANGQGTN